MTPFRLLAVLAHPDDESLGFGGSLARYAREGVETHLVTATRGEGGRYRDGSDHPGSEALGQIREAELRAAVEVLGIREHGFLDYPDGGVDRVDPVEAVRRIAGVIRRVRPQVVLTFGPEGAYGHPDHIAISQFTTAAVVEAASQGPSGHAVSKLYYLAWPASKWSAYEAALKRLVSRVDGVERRAAPWPEWAVTTVVDTRAYWEVVWEAVQCHESQMSTYSRLADLDAEGHEDLWGSQDFYRAMSRVNGGRELEDDLFEGLRGGGE